MAQEDEALLRELHSGLEVVKTQQAEINRRLGNIEIKQEGQPSRKDLDDIEEELAERKSWWSWLLQTIGTILVASIMLAIGKATGLNMGQ
ncbi:hypothetical protein [Mesorhizobium sp. M0767]|uniref:hypothetical protein n=1 Tax=Mesorhizobium sp. M0767 TaxID=2956995 RepID=UPI003334C6DD